MHIGIVPFWAYFVQLKFSIKKTNIESEEKVIPKADIAKLPVICVGDILFCDRIISKYFGLEWQIGADIDRNCLVIPRHTIRLVFKRMWRFEALFWLAESVIFEALIWKLFLVGSFNQKRTLNFHIFKSH